MREKRKKKPRVESETDDRNKNDVKEYNEKQVEKWRGNVKNKV